MYDGEVRDDITNFATTYDYVRLLFRLRGFFFFAHSFTAMYRVHEITHLRVKVNMCVEYEVGERCAELGCSLGCTSWCSGA